MNQLLSKHHQIKSVIKLFYTLITNSIFIYRSIRKEITVRHSLIQNQKSGINITLKTTRTVGKTQVCEYDPGKSKLHLF